MIDDETNWTGGYGRPPHKNRFRKGQSGNPSGRARGPKPVQAVGDRALEALREPVIVNLGGGKKKKMPAMDAIIYRGRALALTSDRLPDITRFMDAATRLGFNYIYEEGAARIEERRRFREALDHSMIAVTTCHEEIRKLQATIARLTGDTSGSYPVE